MIAYVDSAPEIELRNGHFVLTLTSGEDRTQFILTRHALFYLLAQTRQAQMKAREAELDEQPIPFPKCGKR